MLQIGLKLVTGAVFAYARKYFTIYTKVSDYESFDSGDFPDSTFREFYWMLEFLSNKEEKPQVITQYVIIACQLMWLSYAIVLNKVRNQYGEQFKPEHWLPYIMNGGRKVVNDVLYEFISWYAELLRNQINPATVSLVLTDWLESLTEDVAFAIDQAHVAQGAFPYMPIVSKEGKPR